MGGSSTEERKASFFRVLLEDFDTKLEIPQAGVESFELVPKRAKIRTQHGLWSVTIKKTCSKSGDDRSLHLEGRGWLDLVKQNDLMKGDFLVFSFMGGSLFHVFVFGKTSCLKKKLKASTQPKKNTSYNPLQLFIWLALLLDLFDTTEFLVDSFENSGGYTPRPHFEVTLNKFNLFGLRVPADFVRKTGMQKMKKVTVKDCEGKEWPVKLKSQDGGGLVLGDGWNSFLKENDLKVGMTCIVQSSKQDDADDVVLLVKKLVMLT